MAASASGSAKVVRAILERGVDTINEVMVRPKHTAVHEAAKGGHLDCLMVRSHKLDVLLLNMYMKSAVEIVKKRFLFLTFWCNCNYFQTYSKKLTLRYQRHMNRFVISLFQSRFSV